ncbi:MAG: 23S rRNA (adenine(2503)-C(2))-methyltransferase RlmN [Bacteroidetes bacterium]|nr:23S rRNA (adenine(2503)-C(2))-methyltransferase RlmN [Bacteroidota bacterium]MDA0874245.1 23S rRNA (adenine(2503)-C(2))-methyltransferase RlmN [Bacteroidota bacterium]
MAVPDILSFSRAELKDWVSRTDAAFRADQVWRWLWKQGVRSVEDMTNLPSGLRQRLADEVIISRLVPLQQQQAYDGTIKFLFGLSSGRSVETVLIPDFNKDGSPKRMTVCVSSQVGCAMGCAFCATGLMGFQQNLTSGEIAEQVLLADQAARKTWDKPVSNVVFMGMGEPLLNYEGVIDAVEKLTSEDGFGLSPKRITVSTVGLAMRIRQLADDGVRFGLAVSLHAPFDSKRSSIMPVNRKAKTDLDALMASIEYFTTRTGQRITYEYCMFAGFNDSVADARELASLVARAPSKVNLIMYNPVEGLGFSRSPEDTLERFLAELVRHEVTVTVRRSRGQDIDAACGQLAIKSRVDA